MKADLYLISVFVLAVFVSVLSLVFHLKKYKSELLLAIKPDITNEQMKEFEKRVSTFLRENHIEPGTQISSIGKALNIREGEIGAPILGQAHLSAPNEDGTMVVTFRKGLSQQERKFAFAHECGHIINKDELPIDRPDGQHKPYIEQAADYVAAALLMPIDDVYLYLSETNYQDVSPRERVKLTQKLCKIYGVDKFIVLRRIKEVYALKELT